MTNRAYFSLTISLPSHRILRSVFQRHISDCNLLPHNHNKPAFLSTLPTPFNTPISLSPSISPSISPKNAIRSTTDPVTTPLAIPIPREEERDALNEPAATEHYSALHHAFLAITRYSFPPRPFVELTFSTTPLAMSLHITPHTSSSVPPTPFAISPLLACTNVCWRPSSHS